jgi:hypothetical protein
MYSEIKPNTAEKQELARRKLVQTLKDNPKLSMNACWDKVKKENPQLFGELQAADWMEENRAEEQEKGETHGSFKPSNPGQYQFSLAPTQVESAREEAILCVGGFFNPL